MNSQTNYPEHRGNELFILNTGKQEEEEVEKEGKNLCQEGKKGKYSHKPNSSRGLCCTANSMNLSYNKMHLKLYFSIARMKREKKSMFSANSNFCSEYPLGAFGINCYG